MEQFKRAQVIMLPTKEKSNTIKVNNTLLYYKEKDNPVLGCYQPQHLYIISDEEIREGDWVLCLDETDSTVMNWNINQCIFKHIKGGNCTQCKKIIATTDTSLTIKHKYSSYLRDWNLPQSSQQFIEKFIEEYNKGNIITNVLVEYETLKTTANNKHFGEGHIYSITNKLKINPKDNTITIKKLKDSWNREEVSNLIKLFANNYQYASNDIGYNKWIEENL